MNSPSNSTLMSLCLKLSMGLSSVLVFVLTSTFQTGNFFICFPFLGLPIFFSHWLSHVLCYTQHNLKSLPNGRTSVVVERTYSFRRCVLISHKCPGDSNFLHACLQKEQQGLWPLTCCTVKDFFSILQVLIVFVVSVFVVCRFICFFTKLQQDASMQLLSQLVPI